MPCGPSESTSTAVLSPRRACAVNWEGDADSIYALTYYAKTSYVYMHGQKK